MSRVSHLDSVSIPRSVFVHAVESGIDAAFNLEDTIKWQLRAIAVTAPQVGDNFSNGCPLMQANAYDKNNFVGTGADRFVSVYDTVLGCWFMEQFGRWPHEVNVFQIEDE